MKREQSTNRPSSVINVAILEFIVGAIVLSGGAALSVLTVGGVDKGLGVVHAILGFLAFPAGYALLSGRRWAWTLVLSLNIITILFNAISESIVVVTGTLSDSPLYGSIGGTTVAILIYMITI
jgi:hypothetical protein